MIHIWCWALERDHRGFSSCEIINFFARFFLVIDLLLNLKKKTKNSLFWQGLLFCFQTQCRKCSVEVLTGRFLWGHATVRATGTLQGFLAYLQRCSAFAFCMYLSLHMHIHMLHMNYISLLHLPSSWIVEGREWGSDRAQPGCWIKRRAAFPSSGYHLLWLLPSVNPVCYLLGTRLQQELTDISPFYLGCLIIRHPHFCVSFLPESFGLSNSCVCGHCTSCGRHKMTDYLVTFRSIVV